MRIKVVAPTLKDKSQRQQIECAYRSCVSKGSDLDLVEAGGPIHFENRKDLIESERCILEKAKNARKEGYDAVMPDCVMDPAVDAIRDRTGLLTLGPLFTSLHVAALIGPRTAILVRNEFILKMLRAKINTYGIPNAVTGRSLNLSYDEFDNEECLRDAIIRQGEVVKKHGASSLILGCTTIVNLESWLHSRLSMPIIAPGKTTLRMLESIFHGNCLTSYTETTSPMRYSSGS